MRTATIAAPKAVSLEQRDGAEGRRVVDGSVESDDGGGRVDRVGRLDAARLVGVEARRGRGREPGDDREPEHVGRDEPPVAAQREPDEGPGPDQVLAHDVGLMTAARSA